MSAPIDASYYQNLTSGLITAIGGIVGNIIVRLTTYNGSMQKPWNLLAFPPIISLYASWHMWTGQIQIMPGAPVIDEYIWYPVVAGLGSRFIVLVLKYVLPGGRWFKWIYMTLILAILMSVVYYIRENDTVCPNDVPATAPAPAAATTAPATTAVEGFTEAAVAPAPEPHPYSSGEYALSLVLRGCTAGGAIVVGSVFVDLMFRILGIIPPARIITKIITKLNEMGLGINEAITAFIVYIVLNVQVNNDYQGIICYGKQMQYFATLAGGSMIGGFMRPLIEDAIAALPLP